MISNRNFIKYFINMFINLFDRNHRYLNRVKHRKNQKSIDLSSISNSFIGGSGEDIVVENKQPTDNTNNFYLHQKICDVRFEY